jgi:hypothetical protein
VRGEIRILVLLGFALLAASADAVEPCNSLAATPGSVPAQASTVTELLQVTGVFARARPEADRVVAQLRSQNPRVPLELWEKYAASVANHDTVIALYAPIYARHLTEGDVRGALQFYRSAPGAKLLAAMPIMQAEARSAALSWVSDIAADLAFSESPRRAFEPGSVSSSRGAPVGRRVSGREERVQQLLRVSGTISQAQQMMNDLIDRLEATPQGGELTVAMWEQARSRLTNETDLINLWTPAYLHHLSDQEIGVLLKFYQSATGHCFVAALPRVQKEAVEAATQLAREAVKRATRDVLGPLPQWALEHPRAPVSNDPTTNGDASPPKGP